MLLCFTNSSLSHTLTLASKLALPHRLAVGEMAAHPRLRRAPPVQQDRENEPDGAQKDGGERVGGPVASHVNARRNDQHHERAEEQKQRQARPWLLDARVDQVPHEAIECNETAGMAAGETGPCQVN